MLGAGFRSYGDHVLLGIGHFFVILNDQRLKVTFKFAKVIMYLENSYALTKAVIYPEKHFFGSKRLKVESSRF
jgi:hypothetical protein